MIEQRQSGYRRALQEADVVPERERSYSGVGELLIGSATDVIIVGAGHNGLVSANYLADAGLTVTVVERRPIVGGACVTEELIPGFRASSCAFVAAPGLEQRIMDDLRLAQYGLRLYQTPTFAFSLSTELQTVHLATEIDMTLESIKRQFGRREAEAFLRFGARLQRIAGLVRPSLLASPPSLDELETIFQRHGEHELFEKFILGSIRSLLDEHFESEELKGISGFLGLTGFYGGPDTPGTAYIYSHHAWGSFDGRFGESGFAQGGMGAITAALARRARERGVSIRTQAAVGRILTDGERAQGAVLESGEELQAPIVMSNADPKRTLLDLVDDSVLEPGFRDRVRALDYSGTMARVHIAVDRLPVFREGGVGEGPVHAGVTLLNADLERFEAAWNDQRSGVLPRDPTVELTIQSVHDPSLTNPGTHIITTGVLQLPFTLKDTSWDEARPGLERAVIETLSTFAPGIENTILGVHSITPADLEREYALTEGNIFHGAMTPEQLFSDRPVAGLRPHRTPIHGLYLCGAGTHPGGGVTGAPGYNAAQAVMADKLGIEQLARIRTPRRTRVSRIAETRAGGRVGVALASSRWLRPITRWFRSGA